MSDPTYAIPGPHGRVATMQRVSEPSSVSDRWAVVFTGSSDRWILAEAKAARWIFAPEDASGAVTGSTPLEAIELSPGAPSAQDAPWPVIVGDIAWEHARGAERPGREDEKAITAPIGARGVQFRSGPFRHNDAWVVALVDLRLREGIFATGASREEAVAEAVRALDAAGIG